MLQANTILLPCGSKIHSKSLYLLRFQRYLRFFIFRKNSRWPPKVVKLKFSWLQRYLRFFTFRKNLRWPPKVEKIEILIYYPVGPKFASNRSISYGFRDICDFSFSTKIQDGRQKLLKLKIFMFQQNTVVLPCGSKFARNRYISYGFRDICDFSFSTKIQDGGQKLLKLKIFMFQQNTLLLPCGSKIRLKSLYL